MPRNFFGSYVRRIATLWTLVFLCCCNGTFADENQNAGNPFQAELNALRAAGELSGRGVREPNAAIGQSFAGGTGADFASLIQLIQNETEGPWEDIEGTGGTIDPFESGIRVDPTGVLTQRSELEESGRLTALGIAARTAALNEDMAKSSPLRLVSLTRLQQEISRRVASGKGATESMRHLAGLAQVRYVFVYSQEGEIVIGGPAEGWRYDQHGRAVGVNSARPTLELDDLVTLLRTFSENGSGLFGCSIDPRPENLKKVKDFVAQSQTRGPLSSSGVRRWADEIGQILGPQDITVHGIPANSRVARVLVEADYRMKLIGLGKLEGGSHVPDYFELLAKEPSLASSSLDALRWWMTMKYDAVLHSADGNSFEFRGPAVQCQSENQFLTDSGKRVSTGKAEPINQLFAANFTEHYAELAMKDPIFADLQGIFDLALAAAVIQRYGLDDKIDWDRGAFDVNGGYEPATYRAPRQTMSVVNYRVFGGKDVVLQVAGGVRADVAGLLADSTVVQESPRLGPVAEAASAPELPVGHWWWDAK